MGWTLATHYWPSQPSAPFRALAQTNARKRSVVFQRRQVSCGEARFETTVGEGPPFACRGGAPLRDFKD